MNILQVELNVAFDVANPGDGLCQTNIPRISILLNRFTLTDFY